MNPGDPRRALVRDALTALDVQNLTLGIHDQCFPATAGEDTGRGTPYSAAALDFLRFARDLGFDGVQFGPQGQTSEGNPSPYDGTIFSRSALDVALGPLVEGAADTAGLLSRATLDALVATTPAGSDARVQYRHAFWAQRRALGEAFARYRAGGFAALERRLAEFATRGAAWLERDALYAALEHEHQREDWRGWPGIDARLYAPLPGEERACEARRGELASRHAELLARYAFEQLLAHEQHGALRRSAGALGMKLFGDLQIGYAHRDVWSYRAFFLGDYLMGAPPSRTNPDGQPWNYPVLDPAQYFAAGDPSAPGPVMRLVRARVRKMLAEFDGVRIDHPHGLVDPWVYDARASDPLRAVQRGARLYSSPDLPDHPALARYAIAQSGQIDRAALRHADHWVRALDPAQVERYAALLDVVIDAAREHGRQRSDLVCEVLSTLPYPLGCVLERHGLGRFRVTQKADPNNPRDVYRSEVAEPADWIMMGNHDTRPVWLLADQWAASGAIVDRARQLAARLLPDGGDRVRMATHIAGDAGALAHALFADVLASRARNVLVFFADLLGSREVYNSPGVVSEENWSLRVAPDYARAYAEATARGLAIDLPRALAAALRARGGAFAAAHAGLAGALDRVAVGAPARL